MAKFAIEDPNAKLIKFWRDEKGVTCLKIIDDDKDYEKKQPCVIEDPNMFE